MDTPNQTPKTNPESIDSFLIAEYQSVLERSLRFEDVKANRINFFLFLVGAVAAGLGSLVGISFVQANIYLIGIGMALFLGVLGWQTLMHSVQYSMAIISLYRISGRTRRWFYEKNPASLLYLSFEPSDNKPSLLMNKPSNTSSDWNANALLWRGGEPILLTINSILIGVFCCLIAMWGLRSLGVSFQFVGLAGIVVLLIAGFFFWRYQRNTIVKILSQREERLLKREFHGMTEVEYRKLIEQAIVERERGRGSSGNAEEAPLAKPLPKK